ncbi:MAG: hypothetical protein KAW46_09030, partial [candidate division Zixibacteria bacterium]|nr:hypothetical protein [candidate division Zixibacteria bacterium]
MADTAQPLRGLFFGFRQFVYRDAMYIVSGLAILTAILYSFGKLSLIQPNMLFTPTIVLLAFVVGYVT